MRGLRTKSQIEASKLDLEIYRLMTRILSFGEDNNIAEIRQFAHELSARRYLIRKHMCKEDREVTA